ncbi:MAG: ATP-binding cassette domain-containing protein [Spirochaetia bacterium]|nr:ATP-binding cassette domain-containing protein [Spirochaetia bacterium]
MESERPKTEQPEKTIVSLENISLKNRFNNILDNVSLSMKTGEIHALIGEKGSGKSTLGRVICGIVKPDSGKVILAKVQPPKETGRKQTKKPHIVMIHQSRTANPKFTVWEHLLYTTPTSFTGILVPKGRLISLAEEIIGKYGLVLHVLDKIEQLKEPDYVILELIRLAEQNPDVLIIDEVISQLPYMHISIFSNILFQLKKAGTAVLFITHNFELLYDYADRVSIIRNGKTIYSGLTNSIDKINLIRLTYTENIRKQKSRTEEEEFYTFLRFNQAILENLPVNLLVLDVNNYIVMANKYFENSFEIEQEFYLHQPISSMLKWQSERLIAALKDSIESRKLKILFNVPIVTNGRQTINTLKILPIHDGVSTVGQILVIEDVTDYFNFQKEIMFSDHMASIGLLAAGVGHEINNSLEIAFNYLRFIKQKATSAQLEDPMSELREELLIIKQIVSKLVDFSDAHVIKTERTDLNVLISGFINLIKNNKEYENIYFSLQLSEKPVLTDLNSNEFRELLTNIVKNSREEMPEGGEITISTQVLETDTGCIARLVIKDTGPGIPAKDMESIFLPFYSTKKKNSKNIGLGLSLCYSIIDRIGGSIYIENTQPKGCRFIIELPVISSL